MRAATSTETYHKEIKGKTNKQNVIVLQAMNRLGKASTDKEIMEVTKLFTDNHEPLDRNVVTRVLNNLREDNRVDYIDVKNKEGRKVHHHFIVEPGKQQSIF